MIRINLEQMRIFKIVRRYDSLKALLIRIRKCIINYNNI